MRITWAQQPYPDDLGRSIFLAGPTLRIPGRSWRQDACELMSEHDVDVFVPEPPDHSPFVGLEEGPGYGDQVEWEHRGLEIADTIVFWVPRDLIRLPGFTTNVEFGMWCRSGKVILGHPPGAPKMRYLDHLAVKYAIPMFHTLKETIQRALRY